MCLAEWHYKWCGAWVGGAVTFDGLVTGAEDPGVVGPVCKLSDRFVCAVVIFGLKVGGKRAWVTASNPDPSFISVGSLNAVPMKLMPIGIPSTFAAGTLMIGYPGPPANPELANKK